MPSLVTSIKQKLKSNSQSYCFNSVIKKWTTMRMMTQIMIINFLILLLIFGVTLGALMINLNQIVQSLESDIHLMLTQQTAKVQNMLMQRYVYLNVNLFESTSSALTKTNFVYQLEQQNYKQDLTYICSNTTRLTASFANLCISPQTSQDHLTFNHTPETDIIMNFTGLLNTLLFQYDITQQFALNSFYYTFNTTDQFFGGWPGHGLLQSFKPLSRPWYIQHQKQKLQNPQKNLFYSDIYSNAQLLDKTPLFGLTQTQSLINNSTVSGVVAHDINLTQIKSLLPNPTNMNLMLVYNNGTILFQNTYLNLTLNNSLLYFQNQNITGFTQALWNQIAQQNDQQIWFYNDIFQEEIIVNIHKFKSIPFYLVLFSNLDTIDQEEDIASAMIENITFEFFVSLSFVWSLFICIQFICYLLIQSITKPIRDIQSLIEPGKSDNKKNIFLQKISQTSAPQSDNSILQLFNCVTSRNEQLEKTSFIKSQECFMIERFVYNTQDSTRIVICEEIDFLQDFNELPESYSQQFKFMLRNIIATRYL